MHVGPLDQEYDRLVAHLSVDQLEPGMVLASDVMTGRGHRLIASGQELSDRHLQGLKTWGIAHVEIQGDAPEATQVSALFTEAAEGRLTSPRSMPEIDPRNSWRPPPPQ